MAITKSDIHAAADQLTAAGQRPTLAAVRRAVGGGSFTTISEAMAEWNQARRGDQTTVMREAAPTPVMERLATLANDLWSEALALANQRMQAERNAMEEERQAMEASRQEAVEVADQLAIEVEQGKAELLEMAQRLAAAHQQLESAQNESLVAKTHSENLKTQVEELKKALADAVDGHEAMAMQTSAQATRLEHAETELAALKEALQAKKAACQELRSMLETEKQHHAKAQAHVDDLKREAAEQTARASHIETDLKKTLAKMADERQALTVQASTQATRLEHAESVLQEAKAEVMSARLEARQAIEAAAELRGQLKTLEGKTVTREKPKGSAPRQPSAGSKALT